MVSMIYVFLPSFVEIGKAEVTKPRAWYSFTWSLFPILYPSAKFRPNPFSYCQAICDKNVNTITISASVIELQKNKCGALCAQVFCNSMGSMG